MNNALKSGKMVRRPRCQICGRLAMTEGHHYTYAEDLALDVIFVCRRCHRVCDELRRAEEEGQKYLEPIEYGSLIGGL